LIDGDFGTNVCRYLFYFKFFASDNFVLLATGFYDRVHDLKPHQMLKEFPGRSRGNRRLYMGSKFSSKGMHKAAGSWYVGNVESPDIISYWKDITLPRAGRRGVLVV
jgi:hypothetical protein